MLKQQNLYVFRPLYFDRAISNDLIMPVYPCTSTALTPFFRTDPLLYYKFGNMLLFRSGNLYSLCSPGNQNYQKIINS